MADKVHRIHSLPDDAPWTGGLPPAGSDEHPGDHPHARSRAGDPAARRRRASAQHPSAAPERDDRRDRAHPRAPLPRRGDDRRRRRRRDRRRARHRHRRDARTQRCRDGRLPRGDDALRAVRRGGARHPGRRPRARARARADAHARQGGRRPRLAAGRPGDRQRASRATSTGASWSPRRSPARRSVRSSTASRPRSSARSRRAGGASFIGKALPFGIGAAVGGAGNNILGRRVLIGSRRAFGLPPLELPADLEPRPDTLRLEHAATRGIRRAGGAIAGGLTRGVSAVGSAGRKVGGAVTPRRRKAIEAQDAAAPVEDPARCRSVRRLSARPRARGRTMDSWVSSRTRPEEPTEWAGLPSEPHRVAGRRPSPSRRRSSPPTPWRSSSAAVRVRRDPSGAAREVAPTVTERRRRRSRRARRALTRARESASVSIRPRHARATGHNRGMDSTLACLAAWMPRQRWYAAKGRPPSLRLVAWWEPPATPGTPVDHGGASPEGDDARVRTFLVADEGALPAVLYQIPVVSRATASVDASPDHIIGSPEPGTTFIDGPFDPAYTAALLSLVTSGGQGGGPRAVATGHPTRTVSMRCRPDGDRAGRRAVQHVADLPLRRRLAADHLQGLPAAASRTQPGYRAADRAGRRRAPRTFRSRSARSRAPGPT